MISRKLAFTLIELLLVVAIIGILAAVAVPNFIHARMRSLVTRSMGDMRSCAIALEEYALDHGTYPRYRNALDQVSALSGAATTYLPVSITSPIAYINPLPLDPFPPVMLQGTEADSSIKPYKYIHGFDQIYKNQQFVGAHIQLHLQNHAGENHKMLWQIWSLGPDRIVAHDGVAYCATNGVFSYGDISQFGP